MGDSIPFSVSLPRALLKKVGRLPGILFQYRYQVAAFPGRTYGWQCSIDPGNPSFRVLPPPPRRGDYHGFVGTLRVEDCFTFFQFDLPLPEEEHLLIFPDPSPPFPYPDKPGAGGRRVRERQPLQTTMEELEIRKYLPGDDPRRIHWKLYAHSGDLLLRVGEPDPLPTDTFHLHFDPTLPANLDSALRLEAVDRMASMGARVLLDLSHRGNRVLLSTNPPAPISPGTGAFLQDRWFSPPLIEMEGGHPEEGLAELARLSPGSSPSGDIPSNPAVPSTVPDSARILFLFEGTPAAEAVRASPPDSFQVILIPPEGEGPSGRVHE
ncbi:MAG: hypothetical protein Kow009_09820 [Spirochaetales bacterium]